MKQDLPKSSLLLLNAADYIEEHGWCQGEFENESGHVCALGALRAMRMDLDIESYVEGLFKLRDHDNLKDYSGTIWMWNDAPDRTKEEVINVLRDAALS